MYFGMALSHGEDRQSDLTISGDDVQGDVRIKLSC